MSLTQTGANLATSLVSVKVRASSDEADFLKSV